MHIALTKQEVNQIDLTHLAHFLQWNPSYQKYFLQEAGKEPYKLIAFLSKMIGGVAIISDIPIGGVDVIVIFVSCNKITCTSHKESALVHFHPHQ